MVKNNIILIFFGLCTLSCKKEDKTFISSNTLFNQITNLEQYSNVQKIDEDSLIKIKADNDDYIIDGYISKKLNKKMGWWNIRDKNNALNKVKLQYIYFENKEKVNQFIFYKDNIIDSVRSKFYTFDKKKQNNKDIITYSFCTPKSEKPALSANLYYLVMNNNNNDVLEESKSKSEKNKNHYQFKLEIPVEGEIIIKGLFSEVLNVENENLGTNEILTDDLISSQEKKFKSKNVEIILHNPK